MSVLDDIEVQIATLLKTTVANPEAQKDAAKKIYSALSGISEDTLSQAPKRAKLSYLKGKVSSLANPVDPKIEQYLSKAIKLNPKLIDAWETLAEYYYAVHQFDKALSSIQSALSHLQSGSAANNKDNAANDADSLIPTKKALLRKLSMTQRKTGSGPDEQRKNTEESAKHAREAVALDLNDGDSCRISELQKSLAAYSKASSCSVLSAENKLDLHYNKAMVHSFMQQYSEALDAFQAASGLQPGWKDPITSLNSLKETINKIHSMIEKKCGLKPKTLTSIAGRLPAQESALPTPLNSSAKLSSFKSLKEGPNTGCVLPVTVVGFPSSSAEVPVVLVCVDHSGDFGAVSVYNINRDVVKFESQLLVLDPNLSRVTVTIGESSLQWMNVKVESVTKMLLDGRAIGPGGYRAPELSVSTSVSTAAN